MTDETTGTDCSGPSYISDTDEDIDAALSALVDDRAPHLREHLTRLIRRAYHSGVIDGLKEDARNVVLDDEALPEEAAQRLARSLWKRAEEHRHQHLEA